MSYILEALKKSDQERKLGEVPRLDTIQRAGENETAKPARTWMVPVLLINTLSIAVLLGYLVLRSPEAPGPRHATEDGPASTIETPRMAATSQESPPPTESAVTLPLPEPEITLKEPTPTTTVSSTTDDTTIAADDPANFSKTGPVPWLSELPASVREQITPPKLEIHVYSESPGRRFVMIGGRQYHEGDRLPGELRLEEITPTGAVLSRHGKSFRIER